MLTGKITGAAKGIRWPIPIIRRDTRQRGIIGCNMAFWRDDIVAVNGFDEDYTGWGTGEDSDIGTRLYHLGRHRKFVYGRAITFHLNHPTAPRDHHAASLARLAETIAAKKSVANTVSTGTPALNSQLMKKIRIDFCDFHDNFSKTNNFFFKLLAERFDVELCDQPDFLIHHCYGHEHRLHSCVQDFLFGRIRPARLPRVRLFHRLRQTGRPAASAIAALCRLGRTGGNHQKKR